jgi:diguanylate cyclase
MADRLAGSVRRAGFLARLGGDEFAVLLGGVDAERAAAVIDLIRIQAGEDGDATSGRAPLKLSAGWTAVAGPVSKTAMQEALERADAALRDAKQSGRNRTRPASP